MAEEVKRKVITTTNKGLIYIVVVESVLLVIFFLSGFNKISPYILLIALIIFAVFIYFYLRKPKELDFYRIVEIIRQKHLKEFGKYLDFEDAQAIPVTLDVTEVYFPREGMTFEVRGKSVKGMQIRHLFKAVREKERSRLFELSEKTLGGEAKIKQQAELLNIDLSSLGLKDES